MLYKLHNNLAATLSQSTILLVALLILGVTTVSVLTAQSQDMSELELEQMVQETIDDLSTYITTEDAIGRYSRSMDPPRINRIGVMIQPLFSVDIDVSGLLVKINNGESMQIQYYSENVAALESYSFFDHPLWSELNDSSFGLLTIYDKDESITLYDTLNDHTDITYLIIQLPSAFNLYYGDELTITLIPTIGINREIRVKAPLPIKTTVPLL